MSDNTSLDRVSKRVNLACHYCRRRKKKCDGNKPTCSNCAAAGENCVYQLKTTPSKSNVRFDRLKSQMDRMEHMITKLAENQNKQQELSAGHLPYRSVSGPANPSLQKQLPLLSTSTQPLNQQHQLVRSASAQGFPQGFPQQQGFPNQSSALHLNGQFTEEEPSLDDDKEHVNDLPDFNDRLEQLLSNQMAGRYDTLVYMSGLFLSIFGPNEVAKLGRKMHNPNTLSWLTKTSNRIWHLQQNSIMCLVDVPDSELNTEFADFCFDLHRRTLEEIEERCGHLKSRTFIPSMLITADDISSSTFEKWPKHLRRGIIAALVLEGIAVMRMSKSSKLYTRRRWTPDFTNEQLKIAFRHCIDLMNVMRFSRSSYMLAKTCVFIMLHMSKFFCVPSITVFMEPLLDLARSLGLNNEALNSVLPEKKATERYNIWNALTGCHIQQLICRMSDPVSLDVLPVIRPVSRPTGLEYYGLGNETIRSIYFRCRKVFFGLYKTRSVLSSEVFNEILINSADLENWWSDINKKIMFDPLPKVFTNEQPEDNHKESRTIKPQIDYIESLVESFKVQIRIKYLLTKLIIHTIPAFYPHYLPKPVPEALEKVSETARDLLRLAVSQTLKIGVCNYAITLCTTAGIGVLLFKQLKYSDNPTNKDDIDFIKQCLPQLNVESWPSAVNGNNPIMELWDALVHIMVAVYEGHEQTDSSDHTETPGSNISSESSGSNQNEFYVVQRQEAPLKSRDREESGQLSPRSQQPPRGTYIPGIVGAQYPQNVPQHFAKHPQTQQAGPSIPSSFSRANSVGEYMIKKELDSAGIPQNHSPRSSASTPSMCSSVGSVPSNASLMSLHAMPPIAQYPQQGQPLESAPMSFEFHHEQSGRVYSNNQMFFRNPSQRQQQSAADTAAATAAAAAAAAAAPQRERHSNSSTEQPQQLNVQPSQDICDFDAMLENHSDMLLRDMDQPDNCSIV